MVDDESGELHTISRSDYMQHRLEHKRVLKIACLVSANAAGQPSRSGRQYWSSVLFTKLVVSSITLSNICPAIKADSHWDFTAVASVARGNTELLLFFYWLCVEPKSDAEWFYRSRIFWLMDNRARQRLVDDGLEDADGSAYHDRQAEIHAELKTSAIFNALLEKRKTELLRGDKSPYIQDEILERIGINRSSFRMIYRYFSSFVHTGPVSVYRMAEHGRGNGVENNYDRSAIAMGLMMNTQVLATCTEEMMMLHPDAAIKTIQKCGREGLDLLARHRLGGRSETPEGASL